MSGVSIPETCSACLASRIIDEQYKRGYCTRQSYGPQINLHLDMPPEFNLANDPNLKRSIVWTLRHVCSFPTKLVLTPNHNRLRRK